MDCRLGFGRDTGCRESTRYIIKENKKKETRNCHNFAAKHEDLIIIYRRIKVMSTARNGCQDDC
jgi:hypothetical protein